MALFGRSSFLAERVAHPEADITPTLNTSLQGYRNCVDFAPMGRLIGSIGDGDNYCIETGASRFRGYATNLMITRYITNFELDNDTLSNAFTSAALIANQIWLAHNTDSNIVGKSLSINFDMGADSQVPTLSRAGMIAASVVMGLFLAILFVLVLYSLWTPRWTSRLDAFAMIRIGAAMPDRLPLSIGRNADAITELDDNPGWAGDAAEDDEFVRRLGLGAPGIIHRKRRYECYVGDAQQLTISERKELHK